MALSPALIISLRSFPDSLSLSVFDSAAVTVTVSGRISDDTTRNLCNMGYAPFNILPSECWTHFPQEGFFLFETAPIPRASRDEPAGLLPPRSHPVRAGAIVYRE